MYAVNAAEPQRGHTAWHSIQMGPWQMMDKENLPWGRSEPWRVLTGMFFTHCWDMCPYNSCRAGFQIIRKWWLLCPTLKGSFSLFLCLLQPCIWYVGWDGVLRFLGGQIMRSLIQNWRNYSRPGDSGLWGNSSGRERGIGYSSYGEIFGVWREVQWRRHLAALQSFTFFHGGKRWPRRGCFVLLETLFSNFLTTMWDHCYSPLQCE